MERSIARRLNALNASFYDGFAEEFARSRARLNPGIDLALSILAPFETILDLGCGDGRVGRALRSGELTEPLDRWDGRWVGVDRSEALLAASGEVDPRNVQCVADLTQEGWEATLPFGETAAVRANFDALVCFSALHHIPGADRRRALLGEAASLLRPGGRFALSVWQLLHRERFRRRLLPWRTVGLEDGDVEPGDLLLDWKRGGEALRYVHHFETDELVTLCAQAGLVADLHFRSDGDTGDLGLYVTGHRPRGSRLE